MLTLRRLVIGLITVLRTTASYECDRFSFGQLCSLSPISAIIDLIPGLEDEQECQATCLSTSDCNYFTFVKFLNTSSDCFLLRECQNKTSCTDSPDCIFSIAGPKAPPVMEACCDGFENTTCEKQFEIDHFYGVEDASECQGLCQDTKGCNYWSLHGDVCILYSECGAPEGCSSCSSGPVSPDISSCSPPEEFDTLVIGGTTSFESHSASLELLTSKGPWCRPQLENPPLGRSSGAAVLVGSKILTCGGVTKESGDRSCLSLDIDKGDWKFEANMTYARVQLGMASVGDTVYATGGANSTIHDSVEVFSEETGWKVDERLNMNGGRRRHCSVALGSWLFMIGGLREEQLTNSVEAFDTNGLLDENTHTGSGWIAKADTIHERYLLACQVARLEGEVGIYAGGGIGSEDVWSSVEFYSTARDTLRAIGQMGESRKAFAMSFLGQQVIVTGGAASGVGVKSSMELFNGTSWIPWVNLIEARIDHVAVSVPLGHITCQ